MGTHNICFYKEVDKNYTGCNMKTTEPLDCALIVVCAVIKSDTVYIWHIHFSVYSKTTMTRTPMARTPVARFASLIRARFLLIP